MQDGSIKVENGCEAWKDCFSCPFPDCCIGVGGKIRKRDIKRFQRGANLEKEFEGGNLSTEELAKKFGLSASTIMREKRRYATLRREANAQ